MNYYTYEKKELIFTMFIEKYGISKKTYKKLINDPKINNKDIYKKIKKPNVVFRYRRFGYNIDNEWVESCYWKEDADGICKFSTPNHFNKNDNMDCKVYFDSNKVLKYMVTRAQYKKMNCEQKRVIIKALNDYKQSLQSNALICCFTTTEPTCLDMWENSYFGDFGRGFCIEYKFDTEDFKPDYLNPMPVLYDKTPFDSTDVIKAIIDMNNGIKLEKATEKLVCLGYGHTLIKPLKYANEREWRIVIPVREDNKRRDYFNVDGKCKRRMSSSISSIIVGPQTEKLDNYNEYKNYLMETCIKLEKPLYKINYEDGQCVKVPVDYDS